MGVYDLHVVEGTTFSIGVSGPLAGDGVRLLGPGGEVESAKAGVAPCVAGDTSPSPPADGPMPEGTVCPWRWSLAEQRRPLLPATAWSARPESSARGVPGPWLAAGVGWPPLASMSGRAFPACSFLGRPRRRLAAGGGGGGGVSASRSRCTASGGPSGGPGPSGGLLGGEAGGWRSGWCSPSVP